MKLLERTTAGLTVVVDFDLGTPALHLVCSCESRVATAEIPPDRVLDAFEHPACYLAPGELQGLFKPEQPEG